MFPTRFPAVFLNRRLGRVNWLLVVTVTLSRQGKFSLLVALRTSVRYVLLFRLRSLVFKAHLGLTLSGYGPQCSLYCVPYSVRCRVLASCFTSLPWWKSSIYISQVPVHHNLGAKGGTRATVYIVKMKFSLLLQSLFALAASGAAIDSSKVDV
jgi:hypothetical protein